MICTLCKKEFPDNDDLSQDQSTFICNECQDKKNLSVWKEEKEMIAKSKVKTPSQEVRLEWLDKKIEKVESQ